MHIPMTKDLKIKSIKVLYLLSNAKTIGFYIIHEVH